MDVRFDFYSPITKAQELFHESAARHKLLIGGYSGGKTYPAIFDAFRHMFTCPNHNYAVFRNTWDSLKDNIEHEMVDIAMETGAAGPKDWSKTDHKLILRNGLNLFFRPLTINRQQAKGMFLCGFLMDDPDTRAYQDIISFLYTRLRNPPRPSVRASAFKTVITANYEGHDWLWKTFIAGKKEGRDNAGFAYWWVKTTDNPTLDENYIPDLASMHSQEWMNRYVYMRDMDLFSGVVYDAFDTNVHHCERDTVIKKPGLLHFCGIDVGHGVTVVLQAATDGRSIYFYDEWYRKGITSSTLGQYLFSIAKDNYFRDFIIDPNSAKVEQTSGTSIKSDLWNNWGIRTTGADQNMDYGINLVRDLLRPAVGDPKLYVDCVRCPNVVREFGLYRWRETARTDFDEMLFSEKPVDKDDHCMDVVRYLAVRMKRQLKDIAGTEELIIERRKKMWEDRLENLKFYQENPRQAAIERQRIVYAEQHLSKRDIDKKMAKAYN